jgi:hypothetical protein
MALQMKSFILMLILSFVLQGLILSNALRAQKNAEDESCTIALDNLRSKVIQLRNEALEKELRKTRCLFFRRELHSRQPRRCH